MATVAELRMDVDSRPVKNAEKDLDRLSKSAERTERATNKMGAGARRAGGGVQDYANRVRDGARETSNFELAIGRAIGRLAGFAAGVIGVTAALRGLSAGLKAADDFRALDNRIKLVTNSAEEFAQVQSGLIDISRRTFASIDGTVQAYQRMAGATDRLGISQARLLGVAETVNKAVALSGATSQAAEASLIQFGQALSNNFQASAQEINSLNEQVFALSDAIARGITKITGTEVFRSDLKRLAEDGKLSSELVIAALEAVKEETDKTFGDLDRTFAQIAQRLKANAQIISKEAFGPLLQVKIDFYERFAAALEDPRTIQAAQKFGAQLVDIVNSIAENGRNIAKTFEGLAAAIGVLVGTRLIQFLSDAVSSFKILYAQTVATGTARIAATKAEIEYNAAIASGNAIALQSVAAQRARAAFTIEQARADQAAALAKIADIKAAQSQLATNLELIAAQRAEAASLVQLNQGIAIATGRRAQLATSQASLAKSIAAGIATRKALIGVEAELAAAETAHAAATTRLVGAQTALAASSTAAAAKVGFFSAALIQLRGVVASLVAIVAANPLGVLVVGIAAAAYAIVKFRDEITRALTPFKNFKELADEVGPVIRGSFKIAQDAAESLKLSLQGLAAILKGVIDDLPKVRNTGNINDGLISKYSQAKKTSQNVIFGSLLNALGAVGRSEQEIDSRRTTFEAVLARYKTGAKEATDETMKIGEAANDASKFWGSLSGEAEKTAKEIEKARIEAEKARKALASDIAGGFFDIKIGDGLDKFRRLDLVSFDQQTRDAIFRDFEDAIDGLSMAIERDADLSGQERARLLAGLADENQRFLEAYKDANEEHERGIKDAVRSISGTVLDNIIFNGGKGIGDIFRNVLRDAVGRTFIDPISRAFSGDGGVISNLRRSFSEFSSNISKAFGGGGIGKALGAGAAGAVGGFAGFGIGKSLSDLLGITGNKKSVAAGGAIGGGIGFAFGGAIGAALGAALGAVIGNLFSKPSDNAAGGGVNFKSFSPENQFAKNNDPETIAARDELLNATSALAKTLAELTGSTLAGSGISIQVGRRDGTRIISAAGGDVTTPVGDAQAALDEIFRQLVASLKGGEKALVDYVKAAQAVGRAPDAVIDGLQRLKSVFDLTKEPLSEIASALKTIDDAVNPVIDDLKSLGQSIAGIQQIAQDAAKAVGEAFLKDIWALNIDLQNSVFGQFSRLLEEIRQREEDARLLFQRGAISSQQLGFVQSTGGLQVSKFFEGLSDDDKESLAEFLGLLKTASGDIAVARVKLEEQFNYLIDNVEETARGFEEAAQNYARLNENLKQTADAIRTEFSGLTPRDNAITLQGRVAELLAQARDSSASTESRQSALTALSPTVTQLVEKARQAFGGTEQFARLRDFGLSALDEAATLSDTLAKFNQSQADAAREDVKLLADIRELLNDDRQLPTLQGILDEGRLTNQLIAQQLQAFLNLMSSAGSNLNQITADQLQQAAAAYLAQQQSQIAQQAPPPASSSSGATTAQTSNVTEAQFAQALVDQAAATDRNTTAIANMGADIDSLTLEIRRYVTRSAA